MIELKDKSGKVIDAWEDVQQLYDEMQRRMDALQMKHKRDLLAEYKKGTKEGVQYAIVVMVATASIFYLLFL